MGEVKGCLWCDCQSREGQDTKLKITLELQSKPSVWARIFPMTNSFDFVGFFSFSPPWLLSRRSLCCIYSFHSKSYWAPALGQILRSGVSEQNESDPCCPGAHTLNVWLLVALSLQHPSLHCACTQEALTFVLGNDIALKSCVPCVPCVPCAYMNTHPLSYPVPLVHQPITSRDGDWT